MVASSSPTQVVSSEPRVGMELEFFCIDRHGQVVNKADEVLDSVRKVDPTYHVVKECAHNLLEIGAEPHAFSREALKSLLDNLEALMAGANAHGCMVLPLGTYPGVFRPSMRTGDGYAAKKKVFGNRFPIAGRACGYHFHFELPVAEGFGLEPSSMLRLNAKKAQVMVNLHNFALAVDPVITAFMQSSPFYQGQHLGKDSRVIIYRGGAALDYPRGLYTAHPLIGALPDYVDDVPALLGLINNRNDYWMKLLESKGARAQYASVLDTCWGPVKVNKLGTIEQRGMDVNRPSLVIAVAVLLKYASRLLYEDGARVIVDPKARDITTRDGILSIPSAQMVRDELQLLSAREGLANAKVHAYCSSLYNLASQQAPKKVHILMEPLRHMLRTRKSVSDDLLTHARARGWRDGTTLPQSLAREMVLEQAGKMFREILSCRTLLEKLTW